MLIYANKSSEALEQLSKGIENRASQYINFKHEPLNDPLKATERFQHLNRLVFDESVVDISKVEEGKKSRLISAEDQELLVKKLDKLMLDRRVYRTPTLTLRSLSKDMSLNANKLSWLINEVIGMSFNDYVNGIRIEEFKNKVVQPDYRNYSIVGIAYECGFNSKSAFNNFFKKSEGISPSAWLMNQA